MIGTRISEMREKLGWSQSRLARELKVNTKTIKNWENETSDPSVKNIIQLAYVFSVTSDYLLGIDTQHVIRIDSLPRKDQNCLRTICQVFISNVQENQYTTNNQ